MLSNKRSKEKWLNVKGERLTAKIKRVISSFSVLTFLPLTFCLFVASGCDIFQTRTPQPPQQGQSSFVPATLPEQVITNLESAIEDENVVNYLSCLSDTTSGGRAFSFSPSADAPQQVFQGWNKTMEGGYFDKLVAQSLKSQAPVLTLSSPISQPLGGSSDSVLYSANYILEWPNNTYPQEVKGILQFHLGHNTNQIWSIYYWTDSKTDTLTWSDLKVRASQ